MARLTAARRNKLKSSQFAGPDRSFPIQDRSHAINAKGRARQMLKSGRISHPVFVMIIHKANRKLGKGKNPTK